MGAGSPRQFQAEHAAHGRALGGDARRAELSLATPKQPNSGTRTPPTPTPTLSLSLRLCVCGPTVPVTASSSSSAPFERTVSFDPLPSLPSSPHCTLASLRGLEAVAAFRCFQAQTSSNWRCSIPSRSGDDLVLSLCWSLGVRKTGNIQRKLPSDQSRLKHIKGVVASGSSGMASSPVTPTPPSMTSRMARPPDMSFDIRAVIKQQDVAKDLPLPSLTATQITTCENALKELKQKAKGNGGRNAIDREFDALQTERMQNYLAFSQTTAALSPINRTKNRYINVLPYDTTRVKLAGPTSSDYINASFVQDPVHEDLPRYIAMQGPLPSTAGDVWAMVLQQRCPIIVMLTRIVDGDQNQCALYFPLNENQTQTYGRILVTNKLLSSSQHGFSRRVLEVQDTKSPEPPLTVLHYEYLEWPDYYVPLSTRSVRELIRALFNIPPQAGPFVVHCSAGIGRTGTYCTIDHTLRRILCGDSAAVDIENTVRQFRLQRDGMVQTREQYRFVYEAVIKELEDYVCTGVRPESTVQP